MLTDLLRPSELDRSDLLRLTSQAEAFLQQIDPVVEQLREELPQAGYDRRSLGQLIGQLMQFQEDALGINVRPRSVHACAAPYMISCVAASRR